MSRSALVTGGTGGIGSAIVRRLRTNGYEVVFCGRDEQRAAVLERATGAVFCRADATDRAACDASVAFALERLGRVDLFVANAGVMVEGSLAETTDQEFELLLETNLTSTFRYAREVLPALRETRGSLVLVASDAGVWGETPIGAYSVSKRAVIMLTRMLAVEAGPGGVRVNAVCPGDTEPGMVTTVGGRHTLPDTSEWTRPPLGTLVHARDVAASVSFLASDEARTITGADLLIDGGMRAALRANTVDAERAR